MRLLEGHFMDVELKGGWRSAEGYLSASIMTASSVKSETPKISTENNEH